MKERERGHVGWACPKLAALAVGRANMAQRTLHLPPMLRGLALGPCIQAAQAAHALLSSRPCHVPVHACRQREAEAEEERRITEYMRQRREREAAEAARKSAKREALDRSATRRGLAWLGCAVLGWAGLGRSGPEAQYVTANMAFWQCTSQAQGGTASPAPACDLLHIEGPRRTWPPSQRWLTRPYVRTYELLKQQQEEEAARQEEEEALLDLLRAELEAERAKRAAEERARRQEQMRREMVEANEYQKQLKARQHGCTGAGLGWGRAHGSRGDLQMVVVVGQRAGRPLACGVREAWGGMET